MVEDDQVGDLQQDLSKLRESARKIHPPITREEASSGYQAVGRPGRSSSDVRSRTLTKNCPRGSLGPERRVQASIALGNDLGSSTKGLKLPRIRRRKMQVFSVEEAKTFLKFASPTMYGTLFAVAITTGMRPSECIGLKWQDIAWERGTVSIKRTLRKGAPPASGSMGKRSVQEVGELSDCRIGSL